MSATSPSLLDFILQDVDDDERVADSCPESEGEESDLDEPKAIPRLGAPSVGRGATPAPVPPQATKYQTPIYPSAQTSRSVSGPSAPAGSARSGPLYGKRAPLLPSATANGTPRTPLVTATAGRGGRMEYHVSNPGTPVYYYMVQWRKPQTKKHKTWDGDAYIKIEGSKIMMLAEDGNHMASSSLTGGLPGSGTELRIGSYDCEVDRAVSEEEFKRGSSCLNKSSTTPIPSMSHASGPSRTFKPLVPTHRPFAAPTFSAPLPSAQPPPSRPTELDTPPTLIGSTVPQASFYAKPQPKKINIGEKTSKNRDMWGGAFHDPTAPGAVVLQRPSAEEIKRVGQEVNDVVVDPMLADKMREHQKEGVKFMYRCVLGMTEAQGEGCILADEMGLGKTLQTIALIHTLCKQSPWANKKSIIDRALVVCPVSLVNNWKKEFKKWVPRDLNVIAVDSADHKLASQLHNRSFQVVIIGYERLRKVIKELQAAVPPIGLIVCDEGHRLKSKDTKTTKTFDALRTQKRIILTGTPVQNDLGEYWAMANFACPGILGTYSAFNRQYEKPIMRARMPNCSAIDVEDGTMRSDQLRDLSKEFVLRRGIDVLDNFLPPKHEYVVFVAPTKLQLDVIAAVLGSSNVTSLLRGNASSPFLPMIDLLRKVANSPTLLRKKDDEVSIVGDVDSVLHAGLGVVGTDIRTADISISGKLSILHRILEAVSCTADEKIVVVSNWTSTLNLIQELCKKMRYPFLRLDGSTPQKQRQESVDRFNRGPRQDSMVFLLSSKAGGAGLNLIGANRLVLFDSDWNPSTDLQAMARIHRDGQRKQVYIYRLLTTNTIDEKIYQRQLTKTGLSEQMLAQGAGKNTTDSFSYSELRDIFTLNVRTDGCQTHDLFGCNCTKPGYRKLLNEGIIVQQEDDGDEEEEESDEEKKGFMRASQYDPRPTSKMLRKAALEQQAKLASLKDWAHIDAGDIKSFRNITDDLLLFLLKEDCEKASEGKSRAASTVASTSSAWTTASDVGSPAELDDDVDDVPPRKKNQGKRTIESEESDGDGEDGISEAEIESDGSEPIRGAAGSKRKRNGASAGATGKAKSKSGKKRAEASPELHEEVVKRYDLRVMAENGPPGRMTMIFEKVSKSDL